MLTMLQTTDAFLHWIWRASWQASLVVILVALAQAVFHRQLNPKCRHGLWLLVVFRLLLPCSVQTELSIFNWVSGKWPAFSTYPSVDTNAHVVSGGVVITEPASTDPTASLPKKPQTWWAIARWTWLGGSMFLGAHLILSTWGLRRAIYRQRPITDGAVLDLLEDCKTEMAVRTPITLVETPRVDSPALLGFIRPRLLLPAGLARHFSQAELRYVFLHELGHLKRSDIPLNWLLSLLLIVHWFNPLVWYAFSRLRGDRELACDALALAHARESDREPYGQTIIKLLEHFNRPAVAPGLLGILETKNQIKQRIQMIAIFRREKNRSILATSVAAGIALLTLTDAESGKAAGERDNNQAKAEGPPRIVSTAPKLGETDVNPSLMEITVIFDRDMGQGFSWTGGGPEYPPIPEGQKPKWRDKRTCVLPVKLEAGHFYRVGINSASFQNFRSQDGEPARPSAIYFTTQGASDELKRKASRPMIIGLEPKNGTKDVDPELKELRVTFNVPMGDGFSWTGGGPQFPTIPEGKKPYWTEDHKTCILPVDLKPGADYRLGLNSPSHKNFQSAGGVPLDPVSYSFSTK
jgi:beta-lactamase regulating signal transducer with metallopeptidase domain